MNTIFKNYIIFWATQSFSQLGSAMTSFALIIWTYEQTGAALSVSLLSLFTYVPYIIVSIFAGTFIDRANKKRILAIADTCAACCSVIIFVLFSCHMLKIEYVYILNMIIGFMNAFQSPAESVVIGLLIPKDKLKQASGLDSFSSNLITIVSPMLATALVSIWNIGIVVVFDLLTFAFAIFSLIFMVHVTEDIEVTEESGAFRGFKEGLSFLQKHKEIWCIIITMSFIIFFSRLTYENILSPMILARSGGSEISLGIVNAAIGGAGIIGGIFVTALTKKIDAVSMIYIPMIFSFFCGDLLMGIGNNTIIWCIAGIAASFPIPFIFAGQRIILYRVVPRNIQGRIFAVRNAIQFSSIPIGILLGGLLADYIFEPFMLQKGMIASVLGSLVGNEQGSGMAVMFLCTGILGAVGSMIAFHLPTIKKMKNKYF